MTDSTTNFNLNEIMEADSSIWLDRLPLDVCIRISKSAECSNHQCAIQPAVASPIQRTALLRAVNHTLDLSKIAQQGFGDIVNIQVQDDSNPGSDNERQNDSNDRLESGSDNDRESASDNTDVSGSDSDAATASDLYSESCSGHEFGNCSKDEGDNHVCDEADLHSINQNRNGSQEDVGSCRDSGTEHGNADLETDDRSENENANESDKASCSCSDSATEGGNTDQASDCCSDNESESGSDYANLNPSGNETGNESGDGEGGVPEDAEQLRKFVVTSFQRDYAALLYDDVREIVIDGDREDCFSEPMIQSCLTAPSLLKLTIRLLPSDMLSIQHGCNIRSLDLHLDDCEIVPLLRRFSNLQLRELKVLMSGKKCLHDQLSNAPERYGLLAGLFPQVQILDLSCLLCGEALEEPPWHLWNAMEKFPNLKEVTLSENVPNSAIERLREMERITLIAGDICNLLENIPDRITSISTSRVWTKSFAGRAVPCEHGFEMLANCVHLEELNCVMTPGAERGIAAIAGSLRSLGLAFPQVECEADAWGTAPVPLEPKERVLLEIVKSAPFLKSLRLVNMRVQRSELREILIASGTRLEAFREDVFVENWVDQYRSHGGTFLFQQKDNKTELEELAKTLRTAAFNNPELKTFMLDVRAGWFTDLDAVLSTLPKLRASFKVLQRRAVGLNARSLKELIIKFETGYFGMIDMMMSIQGHGVAMVALPFSEL